VEYHFYVENHQGVSKVVPTDAQFNLDLNAIAQALSPRTKVLLINSPNNPSGVVYPAATLQALGVLFGRSKRRSVHRSISSAMSPIKNYSTMVWSILRSIHTIPIVLL
jgi:aspartate aminotransferase